MNTSLMEVCICDELVFRVAFLDEIKGNLVAVKNKSGVFITCIM